MELCLIYVITNDINDKVYVGQTWRGLNIRFTEHSCRSSTCMHLHNAIVKYGKESFRIKLLTVAHTQQIADYWEDFFILKYDSIQNGYNIKTGGMGGRHNEETKQKISVSNIGLKRTPEHKLRQSLRLIGKPLNKVHRKRISATKKMQYAVPENNPMFGLHHNDDAKRKMSEVKKDMYNGSGNPNAKLNDELVNQIRYKQIEGMSYRELSTQYGVSYDTIYRIVKRKTWTQVIL